MKKLMIIDGSSLLFRAFFALPPLKSALGTPTNAVYGFLTMLIKLYEEINPDYIAVAFDKGRQTFRTEMYSEYKGNRPDAPEDLRPQFSLIQDVLKALGICVIEEEGFEGDDILGSLSKKFGTSEMAVQIITGDRDNLQLVTEHSHVFLTKKGISDMLEVTLDNMEELYGYGPDKVIEMKALMGDSSDNIPGVPGVGEKTALKLITEYGDLESVYDHIEDISGKKLKERLVENKDLAFLSRELATIKTDMDLSYKVEDFVQNFHTSEVQPLFETLGFTKLTPRIVQVMGGEEADFGDPGSLFAPQEEISLDDLADAKALTSEFYTDKTVAVHLVLDGKNPFRTVTNTYLSNGDTIVKTDDTKAVLAVLQGANTIVTTQTKEIIEAFGGDAPAEISLFNDDKTARVHDMSLLAYLLDPTRTNYGYLYLTERFSVPSIASGSVDVECVSMVKALLAMNEVACDSARREELWSLYETIELPLIHTLVVMEKNGIYIDTEKLAETTARFKEELAQVQQEIYDIAGETFNINSPKQLGVILFEKMNLPIIKKTKTGYSTDAEVLDMLRHESPIVEKILAYRSVAKLVSTYCEGLAVLINDKTKRIHTTFNQMVTATGRLSSSDPNLQNIPVRTEKGREIRALFYPGAGYDTLVSADYSQIELRVLAHISNDEHLKEAFVEGQDIHASTAMRVFGVEKAEDVTPNMRRQAKAVNFGIVYGISDYGLSQNLGITRKQAQQYIDTYFEKYPGVKQYMEEIVRDAKDKGYVETLYHRRRYLSDINSRNFNLRSFAERTAINTPIQGSAADILKIAMIEMARRLKEEKLQATMLLQVHDELVFEVPESELEQLNQLVKEVMEHAVSLHVPLITDSSWGKTWYEAK